MGKPRRGKDAVTRAAKSYSAYNSTNYLIPESGRPKNDAEIGREDKEAEDTVLGPRDLTLNKHALYQRAVQKPKGDISYLQKFFLNYIGGRTPLHMREDFCGTALISAEWVRGDARRTAVGLDLDEEALNWGLQHNIINAGSDACHRVHLFCGDVVDPLSNARAIRADPSSFPHLFGEENGDEEQHLHAPDMICAFNYSCCCLRSRRELLKYFAQAFAAMNGNGGVFAMDLYGGVSSECPLKLRRRFDEFQYTWEQEDFDVITRTTKISLHFRLNGNQGVLRHAFSYHWRLWTLPEVKECLEDVGFQSVHFWIREMPDLDGRGDEGNERSDSDSKYEEVDHFLQEDAWNAYIVAVAPEEPTAR